MGTAFSFGFSSESSSDSPGFKSPFQDSTTENMPSLPVVCTSTMCVAFHEHPSKLKVGRKLALRDVALITDKSIHVAMDNCCHFDRIQFPPLTHKNTRLLISEGNSARTHLPSARFVVLSFAPGRQGAVFWAGDLVAHAMNGCSMKRKSTTCVMQNLLDCETTRILAR